MNIYVCKYVGCKCTFVRTGACLWLPCMCVIYVLSVCTHSRKCMMRDMFTVCSNCALDTWVAIGIIDQVKLGFAGDKTCYI
jgi:hypothetical protein